MIDLNTVPRMRICDLQVKVIKGKEKVIFIHVMSFLILIEDVV